MAYRLSSLLQATPKPVLVGFALLVALKIGVLAILGPLTSARHDGLCPLCRRNLKRRIPPRRPCQRSDADHADADDRLSGGHRGGESHRRIRLGLGGGAVSVCGFALGNRDGLPAVPRVRTRHLAEPWRRRGAGHRDAVRRRSGHPVRQPVRQHADDCGLHTGPRRVAPRTAIVARLSRRRRADRGFFPDPQRDRRHGHRAPAACHRRGHGRSVPAGANGPPSPWSSCRWSPPTSPIPNGIAPASARPWSRPSPRRR